MSSDLDPLFVKALRLLHSTAKDSTEQLKALLDECLAQRPIKQDPDGKKSKDGLDRQSFKRETTSDNSNEAKKLKKNSPFSSRSSSPLISGRGVESTSAHKEEGVNVKVEEEEEDTDVEDESNQDADFGLELGDLVCIICKQMDIGTGNQLVECHECHAMYHQMCHRPQVRNEEANDPRSIWHCSRCLKKSKKPECSSSGGNKTGQPSRPPGGNGTGSTSRLPTTGSSTSGSSSSLTSPQIIVVKPDSNPFKRDSKGSTSTPPLSSPTAKSSGLAATFARPAPFPPGSSSSAQPTLASKSKPPITSSLPSAAIKKKLIKK